MRVVLQTTGVLFLLLLSGNGVYSQQIVDACFTSIDSLGKFWNSKDIVNLCKCNIRREAANLIEWDGRQWNGTIEGSLLMRPPPAGCNVKGLWIGYTGWTGNGEAFGLRLDKPLVAGKTYTFTFTYARDGTPWISPSIPFSPIVYTYRGYPALFDARSIGRLPPTFDWTTQSFTFTAAPFQDKHDWIILHAYESSGTILSNCLINDAIENKFLIRDTTICMGTPIELRATKRDNFSYLWNTGSTESNITVNEPGIYSVVIKNYKCESHDSTTIDYEDCETRLTMPNIFTPNEDQWNPLFVPKEYNYIQSGMISIFNKWGKMIYAGDLFTGWDGREVSSGIYFYDIIFIDRAGISYKRKGMVTLIR